ncbi:MAG TPA: patatin-like phospholipase family protein, partial [Candidatus Nanopelagicales bacterium]|nr:patatin-like phospholipase family protein [Candidatus Nanopelagicales bacterium]
MPRDEPRADGAVQGVAVVLAGAVAKGAFHAGVLAEIAAREIPVLKVVGTSAGALNGAVFARGVRARDERAAADLLVDLWASRAGLFDVFRVSVRDVWSARGLSSMQNVDAILREAEGKLPPRGAPIQLEMVVSPLRGAPSEGDQPITFEHVMRFRDEEIDTRWDRICQAAAASAAFPG